MAPKTAAKPIPVEAKPMTMTPQATGFEGSTSLKQQLDPKEAGIMSAIARDEAELKGAIVMAKKFPRDENASYNKLMKSCERPAFAEAATYQFPRGGQQISGPSVNLAREAARCWGNVRYGLIIVTDSEEEVHIRGAAFDLETNNAVAMEDKFKKLVYRRDGGWQKPDERDLRELINRRGAICVRNALLQILPPDVVDDAVSKAGLTLQQAAKGQLKQDRTKTIRSLLAAFDMLGVSKEMIEATLKHPVDIINEEELAKLRGIYASIADGNTSRDKHFEIPATKSTVEKGSISMDQLSPKKTEQEPG